MYKLLFSKELPVPLSSISIVSWVIEKKSEQNNSVKGIGRKFEINRKIFKLKNINTLAVLCDIYNVTCVTLMLYN